ncbi:uncharacterized protein LOC133898901 [Phragmites australis]|uniref:uncharacterized protein LOC133898901 n=1 Tax=Phragmites australis TaxID=29695 RepID=UPI002D7A2679|nr:uncharacterized protein LOC133898901 [Phragmites australis]
MPIELPRGLPFAVDTWTPASSLKRHRFLTHAHRDHLAGITATTLSSPVYASRLTLVIVLRIFPQLDRAAFVEVEVGAPPLRVPDPDGDFTVTAFDANHCPGAVMFLFEGAFGTVLHTGDCRLTPDCLHALPLLSCRIDYIFLDCTFARCSLQFPTKEDSIRQVINCIWKHPDATVVYLVCDMLGQEDILIEVSRAFGSKIYVDREKNSECHHTLSLVAPEILTDDGASRFHVIPFPRLSERASDILALARARGQPEPLIIRPSSQWYAYYAPPEASMQQKLVLTEPMRDEFGVWHVCLSMHSSREELEQALGILRPKWVVSTTPPCMAVDLSYVKKHCSLSRLGPDDPLWKLLRISDGMPTPVAGSLQAVPTVVEAVGKSEEEITSSFVDESGSGDSSLIEITEPTLEDFEIKVEPPVALFGRARFGLLQDESELWKDEYGSAEVIDVVELEPKDSATETGSCNSSRPDESIEVIDLNEVGAKEQDSAAESDLLKDCKSDDVVDLTEEERSLSTESELRKDVNCEESIKGNGEAKLEAQGQNLTVGATLWEVCRSMDRGSMTEQGQNRTEAIEEIPAMHITVSTKINREATEDGTTSSEIGNNKSSYDCGAASDSSSTVVGPSKGLNANLRRLYRSMNVPVPRPLPSLVEQMGASKRPRVSQTAQL